MKKNKVSAFTLVEMLIVIVIIGILIASLMPRMQSAQGRARDVARKNDLSQIQTAIITSQQDKRSWPGMKWSDFEGDKTDASENGMKVSAIKDLLTQAWMTQVPMDPNKSNKFYWLGEAQIDGWNYGYLVTTRNSVPKGWFVLMAKTEVEWSSNWVVCADSTTPAEDDKDIDKWWIAAGTDLKDIKTCTSFATGTCWIANQVCTYSDSSQLRYILMY